MRKAKLPSEKESYMLGDMNTDMLKKNSADLKQTNGSTI